MGKNQVLKNVQNPVPYYFDDEIKKLEATRDRYVDDESAQKMLQESIDKRKKEFAKQKHTC